MAKKNFNISSTLKKNTKEKVELSPKVPLKKTTKDPEEVKSKVEKIHAEEIKATTPPPVEKEIVKQTETVTTKAAPTRKANKKASEPAAKPRMVRMTIDTPEEMHLQLKIKSIQSRMSMRDYVVRLIAKDLKKG